MLRHSLRVFPSSNAIPKSEQDQMIHLTPLSRQVASDGEIVKDADGEQPAMIQHTREFQANASIQTWNLSAGHGTAVLQGDRVITELTLIHLVSAGMPLQRPERTYI